VFGIIEIASFNPLEDYKIHFADRIAESAASTISTMESNIRTEKLLAETQEQTRQLARQEEQVRQNLEMLKKTRDEAASQAEQFISFTNTVNHTLIRAEYNVHGILLYANTKFLQKLGYSGNKEVEGKHISTFINEKDLDWFNKIWKELSGGGKHFEGYMKHETKQGQDLWTMATYTCVRKDDGTIDKILFLAMDTTQQKKQSLDYEGEIEAVNRLTPKANFLPDGKFLTCNNLFERSLKYTQNELMQMNVFDFLGIADQEHFYEIWEKVVKGDAFQGQIRMKTKYEEDIWFRATFTSVDDMYGDVAKIIFIASEITREKELDIDYRKRQEELMKQGEELRLSGLDLQKKLDELNTRRKEEKLNFEKEIKRYQNILEEISHPVLTINNLGFLIYMNSASEKAFGFRKKHSTGSKISELFAVTGHSASFESFINPSKIKKPGLHKNQVIITKSLKKIESNLIILKADANDEIYYVLILEP